MLTSFSVEGQTPPSVRNLGSPTAIANYTGGRFGYSSTRLILLSDSTFTYSSWLHTGHSWTDDGTFSRTDSTITLTSSQYKPKSKGSKKVAANFENVTYRMTKDRILMYTEAEERSQDSSYVVSYKTLYLKSE